MNHRPDGDRLRRRRSERLGVRPIESGKADPHAQQVQRQSARRRRRSREIVLSPHRRRQRREDRARNGHVAEPPVAVACPARGADPPHAPVPEVAQEDDAAAVAVVVDDELAAASEPDRVVGSLRDEAAIAVSELERPRRVAVGIRAGGEGHAGGEHEARHADRVGAPRPRAGRTHNEVGRLRAVAPAGVGQQVSGATAVAEVADRFGAGADSHPPTPSG